MSSQYPGPMQFDTRAIHDGQEPDPSTGAVTVPIYQTSTYVQEAVGRLKDGYDYSRTANPTRRALERCVASLESGSHGFAFASGMAATTTVMHLVDPGDAVVSVNDVYGGTYRLFSKVYEPKGVRFRYLSAEDFAGDVSEHLEGARLVWLETPTNPLLNVIDIRAAAEAAHAAGALLVVDNTFASPYLQRPLELGADIVVHSATKYLGGHSDLVSGVAVTSDDRLAERLGFLQNSLGAIAGPFDSWLVLRGLKTLPVRMRQHCENARSVAGFLGGHPSVQRVLFPGIPDHPGHEIATQQMRDYGGMISFLVDTPEHAVDLVARTRVWSLAESLGGVESLIETPAQMTHASTADAPFATPPNLVRLSVGIESADDLVDDLDQALG
jgi:cystathionine gamma-synthase